MNDRHETGADIAAEIRAKCRSVDGINCGIADFLALADRIERAESWLIHVEEKRRNALTQAWEPGSAAAVVRMMLDAANDLRQVNPAESDDLFYYADKLLETKAVAPGDGCKMRAALRKINSLCGIGVVEVSSFEIGSICDAALDSPARNCDIGGFNEQQKRFEKWCYQHPDCEGCIIGEIKKRGDSCELIWAQMKYEAQEGGGHGQE